jgi:PHP domain
MHTRWSDGSGSIEDMARAASDRGYEYIAITDHSKGLKIAGGISEEQLERQIVEIEEVNARLQAEGCNVRVLRSTELNLDPHGKGDMGPKSLQRLDLVLGCFHSALRRKEDQTERYLAALRAVHGKESHLAEAPRVHIERRQNRFRETLAQSVQHRCDRSHVSSRRTGRKRRCWRGSSRRRLRRVAATRTGQHYDR